MKKRVAPLWLLSLVLVIFSPLPHLGGQGVPSITNGTVTVGFNMPCGGTISAIHTASIPNVIDNFDCTGRQIQLSLYDGNAGYQCCFEPWGWNPVQGGDKHGHGSPVLSSVITSETAYIRTRPLEWSPEWRGGGVNTPVLSDMEFEQWVSFVPGLPNVVRVAYRMTHLGIDLHAQTSQEVPATYVTLGYDSFTRYAGPAPWTDDAVTQNVAPDLRDPAGERQPATEEWWSFVDDTQAGVTVYAPSQYRMVSSGHSATNRTNYATGFVPFSIGPNEVRNATNYLVVGPFAAARADIGELRKSASPDLLPPLGAIEFPAPGAMLSKNVKISGWAFDNEGVQSVEILVGHSVVVTAATLGQPRPDVASYYPGAPTNSGWNASVKSAILGPGTHTLSLRLTDIHGNVAETPGRTVTVR
jgi:hypothetical protein